MRAFLFMLRKHSPNRKEAEYTCTDFYVPDETDYKKALRGNPLSCLTTMYDRSVLGDLYFYETYDRHEDYIFWLNILKRGIVAKGNHNVFIDLCYSL